MTQHASRPAEVELAGLRFRPTTSTELASCISIRLATNEGPPLMVGYVNPHVVTLGVNDHVMAEHLARCDHTCIDGIGVALALRLRGRTVERLPAHRAFDNLLDQGVLRGRALVIGIEAENVAQTARSIGRRGRGLDVVASIDGFASDEEILDALESLGPFDVVVIGAGSPRSEAIAELARSEAASRVVIHAGAGTLKVHAGIRRHAPRWLAGIGLDWLHRFMTEPHTRPRYRRGIPAFIRLVRQGDRAPDPRVLPCE